MNRLPGNYTEKVFAGVYGKIIGVRHGAPIEGWTYEKINRVYGEISDYLVDYRDFAADDDINGTFFIIKALNIYECSEKLTPEHVGLTLLNYAPYEHGYFWWGGYGVSTEHTAYLNLRNGIKAPRSGSIAQNGKEIAEQIGGQIFIDGWGLAVPCNPVLAAEFAQKSACVTHDGEGIYGGMFVAACISEAFRTNDIRKMIETGLSVIPGDCEYARVAHAVIDFHKQEASDWRKAFLNLKMNFGYDKYPGVCHIIPNAGVIVLSLLYGEGDFSRTINIANMCGWDTDCNVANVGTILGVMNGLAGIDRKWITPVNDFVACSSVMGEMNLTDVPAIADEICGMGYRIAGEISPESWTGPRGTGNRRMHFEYPGSTHAMRFESDSRSRLEYTLVNTDESACTGSRSLKLVVKEANPGEHYRLFVKTYGKPEDFHDSRYDPSFSPTLYPGQTVSASVCLPNDSEWEAASAALWIQDRNSAETVRSEPVTLKKGEWTHVSFPIPVMENVCIEKAGVEFMPLGTATNQNLIAYVDDVAFSGTPNYRIDFSHEQTEVWPGNHREVSQFTMLKGIWKLEDGCLSGSCSDFGEAYTGSHDWKNYRFTCILLPQLGGCHRINFRVQGAVRSYAAGLTPDGYLALYKNDNGYALLDQTRLAWEPGREYEICVIAEGSRILVQCENAIIDYTDAESPFLNGAVGMSVDQGSHCHYKAFSVRGV